MAFCGHTNDNLFVYAHLNPIISVYKTNNNNNNNNNNKTDLYKIELPVFILKFDIVCLILNVDICTKIQ